MTTPTKSAAERLKEASFTITTDASRLGTSEFALIDGKPFPVNASDVIVPLGTALAILSESEQVDPRKLVEQSSAWRAVWDHCKSLGMESSAPTGLGDVRQFISQLAAAQEQPPYKSDLLRAIWDAEAAAEEAGRPEGEYLAKSIKALTQESRWQPIELASQVTYLLRQQGNVCPCGAWIGQLQTKPHIPICPIEELLKVLPAPSEPSALASEAGKEQGDE